MNEALEIARRYPSRLALTPRSSIYGRLDKNLQVLVCCRGTLIEWLEEGPRLETQSERRVYPNRL